MITRSKLFLSPEGKTYLVKEELHTKDGHITKEKVKKSKPGDTVLTNLDKPFSVLDATFYDLYRKIRRKAQIIPLKDIGSIITSTGIGKNSTVLDAGSGSGALACMLANICKGVVSYDLREDAVEIASHNKEFLRLNNLTIKHGDIREGVSEENIDLLTLDIPDPWSALKSAASALKMGGYVVAYSPTIPQVSDFAEAVRDHGSFLFIRTIEILERQWEVQGRKVRPLTQQIGHSGFLSFARKVSSP